MVKRIEHYSFTVDEHRMTKLFARYWNGNPDEQHLAWKKVRELLLEKEAHPKEVAFAEEQIMHHAPEND